MKYLKRIVKVLLLCCLLAAGGLLVSHRFGGHEPQMRRLTIMTWNTMRMGKNEPLERNGVMQYLQTAPADIICLQEAEALHRAPYLSLSEIRQAMAPLYPYSYLDFKIYNSYRQYGLMVFSRYPLIHKQTVRYESSSNISSRCDVVVGADTFRLFINHLESNKLLLGTDPRDTMLSKVRHALPIRHREARAVAKETAASPYPVLVVGDFNTLPVSYTYLRMRLAGWQWLRDAHLEGSCGQLGNTFYVHGIGGRIDYILTDRSFSVDTCYVNREITASDHFPVISHLSY